DHAVELAEHGVTSRVDDAPLMRFDEALGAVVEFTDQRGGPLLVSPHHAAETGHVDHDDGRELAARYGGFRGHADTIMTLVARLERFGPLPAPGLFSTGHRGPGGGPAYVMPYADVMPYEGARPPPRRLPCSCRRRWRRPGPRSRGGASATAGASRGTPRRSPGGA